MTVMDLDKNEKLLFAECKESVDDIFGWKIVLFLPQNSMWRVLIMLTVGFTFATATVKIFYLKSNKIISVLDLLCDGIYFVDVLCATLHFSMGETRRLRHGDRRLFVFLLIDYISLVPLDLFYKHLIYMVGKKMGRLTNTLRGSVILRSYQIPMGFSVIKKNAYKISTYYKLVFIEVLVYYAMLTHFFGCLIPLYFTPEQKENCFKNFGRCIAENDFLTYGLIDLTYTIPFSNFPLDKYSAILIAEFVIGFIYNYGYVTPLLIYLNLMYLKQYFDYFGKRKQLNMMIRNSIDDADLKEKVKNYFHYVWTYGKAENLPELLNIFPLSFQKTIFCDIHWDAYRHSELLRNLSSGCKRSLALLMTTECVLPKTVLFKKGGKKTFFIYLEKGSIQVMAEENSESTVLNLSDGTILGETSLFFYTDSKATLRTGVFSVIHFLKITDLFRVLLHYPSDGKKIYKIMKLRMKIAKAVYQNKTKICPLFLPGTDDSVPTLTNVKWLKQQFRAIVQLKEADELKTNVYTRQHMANYQRRIQLLEAQLQHTSVCFPLVSIKDEWERATDAVCLKESCPWFLDPDCHFLLVWKSVIFSLDLIVIVVYPLFLGWFANIPAGFFRLAVLINFTYIVDVFLQIITAIKINNVLIYNFITTITMKFNTLNFHLDIVAALPLYFLFFVKEEFQRPFKLNILLSNALVKSYKIIFVLSKLGYGTAAGVYYATFKYVLVILTSIYWSAAILNLLGVECILFECEKSNWFFKDDLEKDENYRYLVSVYVALFTVLDLPFKNLRTEVFYTFVVYFVLYAVLNFLYYLWQGECIASYVLENSQELEYVTLQEEVNDFMKRRNVSPMIRRRVMSAMKFQWNYDKGNYITQKRRILEEFSTTLREEFDKKTSISILGSSPLFQSEDMNFLQDLCKKASRLPVPAGSLLQTFGVQATALHVIHKGYVQINSFLRKDAPFNVSTPLLYQTGDTFPVIVGLSQAPSSITAMALTDCETLILDLEDIITLMFNYKSLPDVVQALKDTNLTSLYSARLGLTRIKKFLNFNDEFYTPVFTRLKFLETYLKFFLIRKGIDSKSKLYILWEITRNVVILFNLIVWPIVFGCCCKSESKLSLIYALLVLDCVSSLVDFYLRLHLSYYNKFGILVSHPMATLLHYLTSSFILDLISFAPNFHILYLLRKNRLNFNATIIITHSLMRSLSLYRIVGLFSHVNEYFPELVVIMKIVQCFFYGFLATHVHANFLIYLYLENKTKPSFTFNLAKKLEPSNPLEYYFYEQSLIVAFLLDSAVFFDKYNIYTLSYLVVFETMATLFKTFIFSVLTLSAATRKENFTLYQYYLRSFDQFLKNGETDYKVSSQAIKHFKFKWEKEKGLNMQKIFSRFPQTLHEDIIFPLYKDTLSGVRGLSKANEGFYRALSRKVEMVCMMKSADVIFEKQVQENIFFIHRGKCYVKGMAKILVKGAVIGDIRNTGLMTHTIKALTHVDLLQISSPSFFLIMQNFYETKKAFELEAAEAEDFISSVYSSPKKRSLIEIKSATKQDSFVECEFELGDHTLADATADSKTAKERYFLMPESVTLQVLNFFFFLDAYVTTLTIPTLAGLVLLSWWTFVLIYLLDFIWIIKIIVATRTALLDPKTGNHLFTSKEIIKEYVRHFNGLVLDVLSVFPVEAFVVAYYKKSLFTEHCQIIYYCYFNRLLRFPFINFYMQSKMNELLSNIYLKLLNILVFGVVLMNFYVCLLLILRRGKEFDYVKCHWNVYKKRLEELQKGYFFALNLYISSGIVLSQPETFTDVLLVLMIDAWSMITKLLTINYILMIVLVVQYTKSSQLRTLQQLEKYLMIRAVSPALVQKMQKYCSNLLNTYKEEAHPRFLKEAPPYIQTKIMENLYVQLLKNCYIFAGADEDFLKQVAVRLERFVYFPGDYIVEKGDVDQNMYFIYKGEVKCLELDSKYPVLERTVDLFSAGESFGVIQGIFPLYPHENTFRAKIQSDILVLNYNKWRDLRKAFPHVNKKIYKKFKQPTAHKLTGVSK